MGLTHNSSGKHAKSTQDQIVRHSEEEIIIALAGNPNVGKSTLFNALTGMRQHTGNWSGKTVGCAEGEAIYQNKKIRIIDLPGTYSLSPHSAEECVASEIISSEIPNCIAIICDATCLERNLILVLQALRSKKPLIVCLNLMDEAERIGITIDHKKLSDLLGCPCLPICARDETGLEELKALFLKAKELSISSEYKTGDDNFANQAEKIAALTITQAPTKERERDRRIDRILTGKLTAFPIMFIMLAAIFWLTIQGANYPSEILASALFGVQDLLLDFFSTINAPIWLSEMLVLGVWRTLAWVIAVMLPPMAIFFPLFTLLEDFGILPRIAFNLDRCFKRCNACGKQALTMCMGFGCNAAGVVGCRIIDSKRERIIAMLTNVFVPCNGRFPTIIAMISIFLVGSVGFFSSLLSALILAAVIILGIILTLLASKFLSLTFFKGEVSSFTLELPPYRKPKIFRVIVHSVLDRTFHVLCRAIAVAAPAGLIIWLLANVTLNEASLLYYCTELLEPIGSVMGMDGVILTAFILAIPANEIVIPIILMAYSSSGILTEYTSFDALGTILQANGWTPITAICVIIFMLCHFPCSTTLMTIKKESGKLRWAILGAVLPTAIGVILCVLINLLCSIFL